MKEYRLSKSLLIVTALMVGFGTVAIRFPVAAAAE